MRETTPEEPNKKPILWTGVLVLSAAAIIAIIADQTLRVRSILEPENTSIASAFYRVPRSLKDTLEKLSGQK